ncbi:hypothetical protein CI15_27705 [Paraburkholderia monticola]|uniref:Acetyl xylan esterase domain-containing protein n=2 Tax=Paraburkholderia monticola TaxID=1399968 RepID=A0A149PCZ9_9BURK|nr:hypothetical protein CI15_27705 [Paraburkholderia monticola]
MATKREYPPLVMPPNITRTEVTIWFNGVGLDADVYCPSSATDDAKLPAVVLTHGVGGEKGTAERYAAKFCAEGMICLTFTHAGWFGSGAQPVVHTLDGGMETVSYIRDVIDPSQWVQACLCAIDYIEGQPNVDPERIGLWGTSFGGGIAAICASMDARVKVLAIQVPFMAPPEGPMKQLAKRRAIEQARGLVPYMPPLTDASPGNEGILQLSKFRQFNPLRALKEFSGPVLIVDAGNEELFDTRLNGGKAADMLRADVNRNVAYHVIDGIDHYGIYFDGYAQGSELQLSWFKTHLQAHMAGL